MTDLTVVKGLIIKAEPIDEYDRRVVIMTDDRGKISAFAKGARRANNKLVADTNLFCFGEFGLFKGRNSYSINEAKISNYFTFLRDDFISAYYGMHFAEIVDYYCRENLADKPMLKLLYQSLRALESDKFDNRFVRAVFEIKAISLEGEFSGVRNGEKYNSDTLYAVDYIVKTVPEKLYSFNVNDKVKEELIEIANLAVKQSIDTIFYSAEILKTLV